MGNRQNTFYQRLVVVLLLVAALEWFIAPRLSTNVDQLDGDAANEPLKKQVDLLVASVQFLGTLAILGAGATAAMLYNRYKDRQVPPDQRRRCILGWGLFGLSLVSGHFALDIATEVLLHRSLEVTSPMGVRLLRYCQFFSLLAAMGVVGRFVLYSLSAPRDVQEMKSHASV